MALFPAPAPASATRRHDGRLVLHGRAVRPPLSISTTRSLCPPPFLPSHHHHPLLPQATSVVAMLFPELVLLLLSLLPWPLKWTIRFGLHLWSRAGTGTRRRFAPRCRWGEGRHAGTSAEQASRGRSGSLWPLYCLYRVYERFLLFALPVLLCSTKADYPCARTVNRSWRIHRILTFSMVSRTSLSGYGARVSRPGASTTPPA